MFDDVSAIPSGGCSVLTSGTTLSWYSGNTRKDFSVNGGKWVLYRTSTTNYASYDISGYNCIDVSTLKSNAQFEPIYYGLAFGLFIFVLVLLKWVFGGFFHVN